MKVYFKNNTGKEILIDETDDARAADKIIMDFCRERDYRIPYERHWTTKENGKTRVYTDFGSHTEFFIVEY